MNGEFLPGHILRQDDIAKRFGVSRAPLREALPRLEAEKIVTFNARHGYAVASLSKEDVTEIFRLRAVLEQDAARLAVQVRTQEDIAHVTALLEALQKMMNRKKISDFAAWSNAHFAFHEALLSPSKLGRHIKVINTLRAESEFYLRVQLGQKSIVSHSNEEHEQMLRAFIAADGNELARLMKLHCERTAERLHSVLAERDAISGGKVVAMTR